MGLPANPIDGAEGPQFHTGTGPQSLVPFPVWGWADLLRVVGVLFLALFFADTAAVLIAHTLWPAYSSTHTLSSDPRLVVPSQGVAYLLTVWFVKRMITHYHIGFFQAVHWNFPERWPRFLFGGLGLAVVIQLLSAGLPIPKQLPIEQFFQSPADAWMMAVFGTLVAPFCEELFFRGLLFPTVLRRLGMIAAVVVTAGLFALIHASQLGRSWPAVAMLFVVGVVLTLVRARAHSLAASVLVHAGYNLALFSLLYVGTAGFRNFSR